MDIVKNGNMKMTEDEQAHILLLGGCSVCIFYWVEKSLCANIARPNQCDPRGLCEEWSHRDD